MAESEEELKILLMKVKEESEKVGLKSNIQKTNNMHIQCDLGKAAENTGMNTFSSLAQSCPTLCDPMDCSTPGYPVHQQLPELTQTHQHESVMPSNHLILCHSLLLTASNFLSIRVFFSESVLCISWPKYWSFSFSIVLPMNIQDW